jgi:DNA-binding IclR family transcriptional regulator
VAVRPKDTNRLAVIAAPLPDGVLVHDTAIDLRRSLRPVAWVVLEELALAAVELDGELMAAASARSVAARLGLDPASAASALRTLRDRGLVELTRASGPAGRFGLSVYHLHRLPGVDVIAPCGNPSHVGTRRVVGLAAVDADVAGTVTVTGRAPRSRASSRRGEQGTLDLGLGRR